MTPAISPETPALAGGRRLRESFLIFGAPAIGEDEIAEVVATLRSGWLGTGPRCQQFEQEFAQYVGARRAIAVNSCTAAMHLAVVALGIGPGDEVIVPAMTFPATANVVEHTGARVVFVDCAPDSFLLDVEDVARRITDRTRAIMPVHFAGLPCDLAALEGLTRGRDIAIVEDAAHAVGTKYRGRLIGGTGGLVCFSFYVTKNLATGEGGMITLDDDRLADRLRVLSLHGLDADAWKRYIAPDQQHYEVVVPGFKYNLTDLAAALGLHQLRRLEAMTELRTTYAQIYLREFADLEAIELPETGGPTDRHAWHLFAIRLRTERLRITRDDFRRALAEENIGSGIHFRPVPVHKYYREKYGFRPGAFPRAEDIGERAVSIPLSAALTEGDVADVVTAVRRIIRYYGR